MVSRRSRMAWLAGLDYDKLDNWHNCKNGNMDIRRTLLNRDRGRRWLRGTNDRFFCVVTRRNGPSKTLVLFEGSLIAFGSFFARSQGMTFNYTKERCKGPRWKLLVLAPMDRFQVSSGKALHYICPMDSFLFSSGHDLPFLEV